MSDLEKRAINSIRALTVDAFEAAGSGHPGMPMGSAAMAYVLWQKFLKHNPHNPAWSNRDRFVQSAGHGSMLMYSLLHLTGYDLSMEELAHYRRMGSKTPGHPEVDHTPGAEMTTGPLGQGISTAVGMALAEAHLAATYNREGYDIVDHYTYVIASDGDLMEGVSAEASSLAGHWGLGKLIVLYDDNGITIDAPTSVAFSEDVLGRYRAYGWQTLAVDDGNDTEAIEAALKLARSDKDQPTIIAVKTIIGFGAPNQGTSSAHGGISDFEQTRQNLELNWGKFSVPDDVLSHYRTATDRGIEDETTWQDIFLHYQADYPELAAQFERVMSGELADGLAAQLPVTEEGKSEATRNASGKVLNALALQLPELIGGSADLAGSNKTTLDDEPFISRKDFSGRNIHFGVREHGMAAIGSGLALHGGLRPYVATFMVFADYLRASLRLAAIMGQPVIYVLSHDSIGVGGDGPTHQPIAQVMSLRAIPNVTVFRPADSNETAQAWLAALENKTGPSVLALTRQNVPALAVPEHSVAKGAYILADCEGTPDVILIAAGSEVSLCLEAHKQLALEGIASRVVSVPSFELFEQQDADYQEMVLPRAVRARVAVEAGTPLGWQRFTGLDGAIIAMESFGLSAPGSEVMKHFGFTAAAVVAKAKAVIG